MSRNTDPFMPWNDPILKDNPFMPHNDPMRHDDPFEPWNDPCADDRDLSDEDRRRYGR